VGQVGPVDWHYDPVHERRAPQKFWSAVPYLDPACGDHKVIWELNRHQHWIALGRAYWLTGNAAYRTRVLAELAWWMEANPPLVGINWASMLELALRSLSWLWALNLFADEDCDDDAPWTVDLLLALDRQMTQIERNISYYFSPNTHLLGEGLALYVVGRALPELAASERREDVGRRILVAEMSSQIESDGGHRERSTHYHRYALDFYLLALAVARITQDPIAAAFEATVVRLASAARLLANDDGRLPHLGDDDAGVLLPLTGRAADDVRDSLAIAAALVDRADLRLGRAPEEAIWMLAHPALARAFESAYGGARWPIFVRSSALPETGYYVSRSEVGDHIVIDGGPHGHKNAGHSHADALSLTCSVGGVPLLIDPGTGCYTVEPFLRDRFRSTAAHNTVEVDGRSQSVARGPFHWERTANSCVHRWRMTAGFDYFDGAHDGYAPIEHRRRVLALHGELLIVADLVHGPGEHAASVHWYLDPQWTVELGVRSAMLTTSTDRIGFFAAHGKVERFFGDADTGLGWVSAVYGRVEPTTAIRVSERGTGAFWIVCVFDLNPIDAVTSVESMPLWSEAGSIVHGTALRIVRSGSTDYVLFAEPSPSEDHVACRAGEIETDARMLLGRVSNSGQLTRLAIVDGSFVRDSSRRGLRLALGRTVPALDVDEIGIRNYTPCAASRGL